MKRTSHIISVITILSVIFSFITAYAEQADGPETRAEKLVDMMAKKDFSSVVKNFDATMTNVMPAEKLEQVWDQVTGQAGNFKKQLKTSKEKVQQYEVVHVTCQFEKARLDVNVVYNKDGKVSGINFAPAR